MGIGNFIKQQAGIGRLPESEINEVTIYKYLKGQVPFVVTLPKLETIKTGVHKSISETQFGIRTTYYQHPESKKVFRKVKTGVQHNPQQIIIFHAFANGKHAFVNLTKPFKVSKIKDGLVIEEYNGTRYYFEMDNDIKNFWKTKGFNPQAIIDVFYNLLFGRLPAQIQQQITKQIEIEQQKAKEEELKKDMIKKQAEIDKITEKNRIKREKEKEKEKKERQIQLKKQQEKEEKERQIQLKKQQKKEEKQKQEINKQIKNRKTIIKKVFDEFYIKIKLLKETYDIEAISLEEYEELKKIFIDELNSLSVPDDVNPMAKIKEAKKLLDMEAITQEEFETIKLIFINKI